MEQQQTGVENNFNYNYLLVQTILKMRDAQAEERASQYWVYFEYGLGLVVSHLDFQLRGEIQQDYALLMAAIQKINSSKVNDASKKSLAIRLKEDFANAHRFYIMQALNRVGVVRIEDEGVIDFESTDIDTFTKVVRDSHTTSAVGAMKDVTENPTPLLVKPEMVMVYVKGELISMPKEDYDQLQADQQMALHELPPEMDEEEKPEPREMRKKPITEEGDLFDG